VVAQRVVDALELVEVEEHDRERPAGAPGGLERLRELLVEARAVRKLGQHVVVREPVDLLDRVRALGRVLHGAEDADGALVLAQRLAEHVQVQHLALAGAHAQVESHRRLAAGEPDEPAPERPPVVLVDAGENSGRVRRHGGRGDPQQAEHLLGADHPVGLPLPLPAADARDALGARQVLGDPAARAALLPRRLPRGLERREALAGALVQPDDRR
jgi:hypothetical protein